MPDRFKEGDDLSIIVSGTAAKTTTRLNAKDNSLAIANAVAALVEGEIGTAAEVSVFGCVSAGLEEICGLAKDRRDEALFDFADKITEALRAATNQQEAGA